MEKRYQVFISSTFQDLQGARQEVSQALLRADCFPAGMELFPAADEEQFEFIKTVIDQSDYYLIISAGRYGSIHPETGLSYTEMEYDYAVEIGKPVIRLLHKDPFNELKGQFIEETAKGRKKLQAFREKMRSSKLVNFWETEGQLGLQVREGLDDAKKRYPADGWVRATDYSDAELQQREVAWARDKIQDDLELLKRSMSEMLHASGKAPDPIPQFSTITSPLRRMTSAEKGLSKEEISELRRQLGQKYRPRR